jgi:divalent metal cation (Fe/Co/Zn/Cd) transporter
MAAWGTFTMGRMAIGRMDQWPAWQRWGALVLAWVLYIGGFWLLLDNRELVVRGLALLVIVAGLLLLVYACKAVLNERVRNIDRWQMRAMLPAFLVYILLALYVLPLVDQIATPWLKAAAALSPMAPLLFVAWVMVRYVNRCDEMERRQHLEASGIAVLVVGLVGMSLGLLSAAKLAVFDATFALLMVLPALATVYGLACALARWRHRAR